MAAKRNHNGGPPMTEAELQAHITNPPPYFLFWWDRFWSSCARSGMRPEEVGGFLAALTMQWTMGGTFSNEDIRRMHFLTGWDVRTCKSLLKKLIDKNKMFETSDGRIVSRRMDEEITKFCAKKKAERNIVSAEISPEIGPDIGPEVGVDLTPEVGVDLSEKANEINKSVSQKGLYTREDSTLRVIDSPPSPPGGTPQPEKKSEPTKSGADPTPQAKPKARPRGELSAAQVALTERAREIWNKAAAHFGFTPWRGLAHDTTRARLARRLEKLGNGDDELAIQRWREALLALRSQNDLTDWLLGKVQRDGRPTFKLDISRFLQTDGKLGDVISRVLDLAAEAPTAAQAKLTTEQISARLAGLSDAEQQELVAQHANGIWPLDTLGYSPSHRLCAIRPENYQAVGITVDTYDERGLRRHGSKH